jgi:hypothetical protein
VRAPASCCGSPSGRRGTPPAPGNVTDELHRLSFVAAAPGTGPFLEATWRQLSGYEHGFGWALISGSDKEVAAEIPGGRHEAGDQRRVVRDRRQVDVPSAHQGVPGVPSPPRLAYEHPMPSQDASTADRREGGSGCRASLKLSRPCPDGWCPRPSRLRLRARRGDRPWPLTPNALSCSARPSAYRTSNPSQAGRGLAKASGARRSPCSPPTRPATWLPCGRWATPTRDPRPQRHPRGYQPPPPLRQRRPDLRRCAGVAEAAGAVCPRDHGEATARHLPPGQEQLCGGVGATAVRVGGDVLQLVRRPRGARHPQPLGQPRVADDRADRWQRGLAAGGGVGDATSSRPGSARARSRRRMRVQRSDATRATSGAAARTGSTRASTS